MIDQANAIVGIKIKDLKLRVGSNFTTHLLLLKWAGVITGKFENIHTSQETLQ